MLTREQYFPGQAPEEQVALFIRRHWMAFLEWYLVPPFILLAIFSVVIILWGNTVLSSNPEGRLAIIVLTSILVLVLVFLYLRAWMSYYLDVTIVTERRLIDIEQEGVFRRSIAEQSLLRVQDVSARQIGFFQHLLNYGSLYIETAGEQPNFELHNIPRPNEVAKTILNLHDRIVGAGGHDVEIGVAEGSLVPVKGEINTQYSHPRSRHPLEELQPYFPEPGVPHAPIPIRPKSKSSHPKSAIPVEGELHEGETIKLR